MRLAEVSKKGEISSLGVERIIGCAETVRKVWLATETMIIYGLPATYARRHGMGFDDLISREEGENGWARILGIIAERNKKKKANLTLSEQAFRWGLIGSMGEGIN